MKIGVKISKREKRIRRPLRTVAFLKVILRIYDTDVINSISLSEPPGVGGFFCCRNALFKGVDPFEVLICCIFIICVQ
jgi:hypothetical protein